MDIEQAKKYLGKQAKYMNLEGEIENIRQLESGMILVYFGNAVLNLAIILLKNEEAGRWEPIA